MSAVVEHLVDATDDATFAARLEALTRAGVMIRLTGAAAGDEVILEAVTGDGSRRARATGRVQAVAGDAVHVALGPFTRVDHDAEQMKLEGSRTAAVPINVAPVVVEPATGPGSTAQRSVATSASAPKQPSGPPELEAFDQLGTYQLLQHLGGGGMAEVYLARARLGGDVDKLVALKTAREGFGPATPYGAMFLDEARVSATLQHPNLIQVFDFGEAMGRPYLAMEFVAGRDLSAALKLLRARRTPASPAVVVALGIALCRALEYVHDKRDAEGRPLGLVHRDVGPANVMVTLKDEVKLMDFGVATSAADPSGASDGLMVGKLPYMPAPQLLGMAPSPSWDLYAVGVTLYQLVSLFHPWQGNPLEYLPTPALRFHRGPPSGANPAIPPELDALLLKATQLEEPERPASARLLREELEAVQRLTGVGDVGAWVRELFGPELEREEAQAQALLVEGRRRSASAVPAFLKPLLRPFEAVRRAVVYSTPYRRLARRPALLRAFIALGLLAVLAPVAWGVTQAREQTRRQVQLQAIDAQLLAGRLTGAGSDDALDLLVASKEGAPGDARFLTRLRLLAERLEGLGLLALERGNLEEAAAHLEAALRAEPGRAGAVQALARVEEQVKERSRSKVVQTP